MAQDLLAEIQEGLPKDEGGRYRYTRKAFQILPPADRPRILDAGCGSGGPSLELARLSGGQVVGLDIDQPSLEILVEHARRAGLSDQVQVVTGSLLAMAFADASFDLLWAEGVLSFIRFEKSLRDWRRLLKPGGFLIVHQSAWLRPEPPPEVASTWQGRFPGLSTVSGYLAQIEAEGYELIGQFALPEDAWWTEYYGPLQTRIDELRQKYLGDPRALAVLDQQQREVDLFRRSQAWFGSAFFVMRKSDLGCCIVSWPNAGLEEPALGGSV